MPRSEGERAAREFRSQLGLGVEPISNLRQLLRERVDLVFVERPLTAEIDGAYAFDEKLDKGFLYINARRIWTRRRFTMAHELGHHVLEHRDRTDRSIDDLYDPVEVQANAFAAELLMPASGLKQARSIATREDVAELAGQYLVSGKAMIVRLHSLGLIDEALRRELNDQYDPRFYSRSLPANSPDRSDTSSTLLPADFSDAVVKLLQAGEITRAAAIEALDIPAAEADELLPAGVSSRNRDREHP
jgi:Zn-dependent peptidase ImmA (M78 family)